MKNDKFNLQEKILIFIGFCLPEIGYKFSYDTIRRIFEEIYKINYSISTLRKEFSILKKNGLITHEIRYRQKIPTLTREGRLKIIPRLPYKKYDPWDKKWRLVIFSIPEKERRYRIELQKKLAEFSFKKIRNGVYISPHPLLRSINRISSEMGIRQHIILLEADEIEQEKRTIQKIWQLDQINKEYKKFIREAGRAKRRRFWPLAAKLLEEKFTQIYQKDPHLPKELLLTNWQGDEAYRVYREIAISY